MLMSIGSSYNWDNGQPFNGIRARSKALLDGCKRLGITKFRHAAASDGISLNDIEYTVAEYRALSVEVRDSSRTGDMSLDSPCDESEDINESVAYISQEKRDKISTSDFAWPEEKKYPITSQEEVDAAARLLGRAPTDKQASIKRRIIEIAKRKGFSIPKAWV